jgi:hypothetical protein
MPANSVQEFEIKIPRKGPFTKPDLKIIFENGQNPHDATDTIGELKLEYQGESLWKLFSKPTGEPFGTNERIFIFMGRPF